MFEGLTEITIKEVSFLTYLLVFLGGIVTSFTPCVYPVIPITAGYIGATSEGSKTKAFSLSLSYILGIAVIYSCLGAVAALSGKLFGEISTNSWTYLIVGNVFLLLGLSMFDVFTVPMPNFLKSRNLTSKKSGIIGAFFIGISAGFIIGPCTAPVLGAVLTYVASKQNMVLGASLLFTFSLGMSLLLLIVGTFSGIAASLPKSGKWLNIVKKIFATALILSAEYFIFTAGRRF